MSGTGSSDEASSNDTDRPSTPKRRFIFAGFGRSSDGQRGFLAEVGIIVLGVLVALSGEQAVQALRWSHLVAQQREVLSDELRGALTEASVRLLQRPCFERRLRELRVVLERNRQGAPLDLRGKLGAPTYTQASTGAWATALNSETLDHMPLAERQEWGGAFEGGGELAEVYKAESEVRVELSRIDHVALLESEDWAALRAAFARAHALNDRAVFLSDWALKNNSKDLGPHPVTLQQIVSLKETTRAFCEPLLAKSSLDTSPM